MKLPVKQILSKNRKHYQIIDNEQKVIIPDIPQIEDAMQIEESLNNYPKVLELLKILKLDCEEAITEYNRPELNEFLKSLQ